MATGAHVLAGNYATRFRAYFTQVNIRGALSGALHGSRQLQTCHNDSSLLNISLYQENQYKSGKSMQLGEVKKTCFGSVMLP